VIGVNIGANKDSADRIADYVAGVRAMSPVARYLTINISSPNTPGLRQLQDEGALGALLSAIDEARERSGPPIFLKVAPDLGEGEPDQIVRVAMQHRVDAIVVANTTVSRPALRSPQAEETGGLSGAPLKPLALKALREFRSASGGELPLIGVGGIATADDAWERIRAGASLVQLYTAMVYEGPGIARRIALGLAARLKREGFANIADAVGTG
jgi:dihydroorotate dehydrogenase